VKPRLVELRVRHLVTRDAFKPGTFQAQLEGVTRYGDFSVPDGSIAFTTRGHTTWASAALAALRKADRVGWKVANRAIVERKIVSEGSP
jgi:hypothetical protein